MGCVSRFERLFGFTRAAPYGIGQPSVVYLESERRYVIGTTDTTGRGGNHFVGASFYVLSAADPEFTRDVQELVCLSQDAVPNVSGSCFQPGWRSLAPGESPSRTYSVAEVFSADMAFIPSHNLYVLLSNHGSAAVVQFFDKNFKEINKQIYTNLPRLALPEQGSARSVWSFIEGFGLLRTRSGAVVPPENPDDCNKLNLQFYGAVPNTLASHQRELAGVLAWGIAYGSRRIDLPSQLSPSQCRSGQWKI